MTKVEYYRAVRDQAIARGDLGVARAINADLQRWGVSEEAVQAPPPKSKRGPKPRCEHGKTGRCADCEHAELEQD